MNFTRVTKCSILLIYYIVLNNKHPPQISSPDFVQTSFPQLAESSFRNDLLLKSYRKRKEQDLVKLQKRKRKMPLLSVEGSY